MPQKPRFASHALLLVYSLCMALAVPLARILALASPTLRRQLGGRTLSRQQLEDLKRRRETATGCVLFYCSSAGEYEQAKPILDRLRMRSPDVMVFILFFSQSGLRFAQARGESAPYALSPFDTLFAWRPLFAALRPNATIIVRHELWPAFLATAGAAGKLYLINASPSLSSARPGFGQRLRARLLESFDRIYTVDANDTRFFADSLGFPRERLEAVSDTKYDRVFERARERSGAADELARKFRYCFGDRPRLIVGSAWPADVALVAQAYVRLGLAAPPWQLVIVPHDLGSRNLETIRAVLAERRLDSVLYSQVEQNPLTAHEPRVKGGVCPVIVVDQMGLLAELYATANLAVVGGAMHHKVHNVLEPACRGLNLAFGPFYSNSQEAVRLVEAGLARVVKDPDELVSWWREHVTTGRNDKLLAVLQGLCGAADLIFADVERDLHQQPLEARATHADKAIDHRYERL